MVLAVDVAATAVLAHVAATAYIYFSASCSIMTIYACFCLGQDSDDLLP